MIQGDEMRPYDEDTLAELLALMPPPPRGWVQAAQELPFARAEHDEIVARARADAEFRQALLADLETALKAEGYEPSERILDALRAELDR